MDLDSPIITEDISRIMNPGSSLQVSIARLDLLHPVVSGNKLFKLDRFFSLAKKEGIRQATTFGGAFSNHLAAAAFACREAGIALTGVIRGEKAASLSHTLEYCLSQGMKLEFVSRETYRKTSTAAMALERPVIEGRLIIPEGGFHRLGMEGAASILDMINDASYTHVCTPVGTGTTLAGLSTAARPEIRCVGISVLKGPSDIMNRLTALIGENMKENTDIIEGYHFGGYASKNSELFDFMNHFYEQTGIPTDFIYTAKMIFALKDLIEKKAIPDASKILCLHTGGLQGNRSLPRGTLIF